MTKRHVRRFPGNTPETSENQGQTCRMTVFDGSETPRALPVYKESNLLKALRHGGFHVEAPCGGMGICGKCKVRVSGETSVPDDAETNYLGEARIARGWRLACRTRVLGDVEVHLTNGEIQGDRKTASLILPGVARQKPCPETERLSLSLSWEEVGSRKSLEESLRKKLSLRAGRPIDLLSGRDLAGFVCDAEPGMPLEAVFTVRGNKVVSIRKGSSRPPLLGAVCDIGTTTLVCYLLDLDTGEQLGAVSGRNPQAPFGGDVISRITHALEDQAAFGDMVSAVRQGLSGLLERLAVESGVSLENCEEVLLVGNTCMHHLFMGIRPITLGRLPFSPVERTSLPERAEDMGLPVSPSARVRFLPLIGGFVGADTVGVLQAVASLPEKTRMVLDLGTNGEIALIRGQRILACSTAAGPAFEGGNIAQGMVACPGAVNSVDWVDGDLRPQVIGDMRAQGICGSGLIDAVAILLEQGVILPTGRIQAPEKIDNPNLAARVRGDRRSRSVVIADGDDGHVSISQKDIRELQLAKGAMEAAMSILLEQEGLTWADVEECVLAGAFGSYVRPASAMKIGLIPLSMEGRVLPIGNGAGEGAKRVLLGGREAWKAVAGLAERTEHVFLEKHPSFQELYVEAMSLGSRHAEKETPARAVRPA